MPVLFIILGIIFLYELCISKSINRGWWMLGIMIVLLSYFMKPIPITGNVGLQAGNMIVLFSLFRVSRKNWLAELLILALFVVVYLLFIMNNYSNLSFINPIIIFVILSGFVIVFLKNKKLCFSLIAGSVFTISLIDFYYLNLLKGYMMFFQAENVSFAILLAYGVDKIHEVKLCKEERKYGKVY